MNTPNELEIIRIFQKASEIRTPPEDIESFEISGKKIVAKIDTMVQSTDMPQGMLIRDAARKSIVACVSDFAAKGARPKYGMVSLNLPRGISRHTIRQMAHGVRQASDEFGIKILGGDTNEGMEVVFHVCIFGTVKKIVARKGARQDELIFATGPFGYSAAGLEILEKKRKASTRFKKKAVRSFTRPYPRLDFGLKCNRYFTSSMDSSDGLSVTLNEMARQSGCKFVIDAVPANADMTEFARENKIDAEKLILHGGEEYEFVFTAPKKHIAVIQRNAQLTRTPIIKVGRVTDGSGVFVKKDDRLYRLYDRGWHHFKE